VKLPDKCPNCDIVYNMNTTGAYLITRTELDFDSDNGSRIEDQIYECSVCHQLFKARWELVDFKMLKEVE